MRKTSQDPTNHEILEAINVFATDVDRQFENVEHRFEKFEGQFKEMESTMSGMKSTMSGMQSMISGMATKEDLAREINQLRGEMKGHVTKEINLVRNEMVTKDYLDQVLDEKLTDLKGDMIILMRKEDTKLNALVNNLEQNKGLSPKDASHIRAMQPFPSM